MMRGVCLIIFGIVSTPISGANAADRRIEKEVIVNAPRTEVWQAWATQEGLKAFLGIESKVECKPGGMYEWYFSMAAPEGQRGGEGCRVLVIDPPELLVFSWNAPPKIPSLRSAGAKTQVFVRLTEVSPNQTKVKLTQLVTEQGPEWDQYVAYFENAWTGVLKHLQDYFAKPDRKTLSTLAPATKFMDQSFELDYPPAKVWDAFTKPEMATQWMTPKFFIELKVGGSMKGSYDRNAFPGDDSWIIRDILAYDPGRMLAYRTAKAPASFPFKHGIEGSHSVIYFDTLPGNKTRLHLVGVAMRDDEETKRMHAYFDKANPQVVEKLRGVLANHK